MTTRADQAAQPDDVRLDGPAVESLIRIAADRFSDLGYLGPDGVLDLRVDPTGVRAIRLELPKGRFLHLQSIGIDAEGVDDMAEVARVRASSWQGDHEKRFDPARLFDFDRPTGTLIHTSADDPAWVEIRFSRALTVTRLRLRNVSAETADRARGLNISVRRRWRTQEIYDGKAQVRAWRSLVNAAKTDAESDPETLALLKVLDLTVRGDYVRARKFLAARVSDDQRRRWFRTAVNDGLLPSRRLEWTVHGPERSFRYWSDAERVGYVSESADLIEALQSLTANVCFGFGSVLSVIRDKALIPHDDDLDIIVGFESEEAATLADALRLVEEHLHPLGYEVTGRFSAHVHVHRPGRRRVDVFVGIFEGETISWYPAARGALTRAIVFPARSAQLLGVSCSIPAQPEVYLERLYGKEWRVPDPYFNHPWDRSAYADISGAPTPSADPQEDT
jgi:hypothetical protein